MGDVCVVVEKFSNEPWAVIKARADLSHGNPLNPLPDRKVDFVDVSLCVDAFGGFPNGNPYPGPNLDDFGCPPYVGDCYANITVDSNNDGEINEFDDAVEETLAMDASANGDDDNVNGIPDWTEAPVDGEDDLAEVRLTAACDDVLPEFAWWSLSWDDDPPVPIEVWRYPDKSDDGEGGGPGDPIVNGQQYDEWPPPESVWLESLDTYGDTTLTFTLDDGTSGLGSFRADRQSHANQVKIRGSCTIGRKYAGVVKPELVPTGVSARITTRDAQLCGDVLRALHESFSAAWVGVTKTEERPNDPGNYDITAWYQIGYVVSRPFLSPESSHYRYTEALAGPGTEDYHKTLIPDFILVPGTTFWYKCWEWNGWGLIEYDFEGAAIDFWYHPNFLSEMFTRYEYKAEILHKQDDMLGTVAYPCEFTECEYRVGTGEFIPTLIMPGYQPTGDLRSDDVDEWGVFRNSGTAFELWDKIPGQ
ncbi:MAG: hypothetical protein PVI86_02180 [Phycisphaerae bacterium]